MDRLTTPDIARLAGVQPVTVRMWRTRFGDFPEPVETYAGVPVYDKRQVERWLKKHRRGQWAA